MRDDLLVYYERELSYLRQRGAEFAESYPKIASRLMLEPSKCEDPHVERLLEGFAFLTARVHLKIDDEFPQITEALLDLVYPHFLRPLPSLSIAELQLDPSQSRLTGALDIPRGAMLYSRPVGGVPCKFRTCYDTKLWPLSVSAAEWKTPDRLQPAIRSSGAAAALRLELRGVPDLRLPKLGLDSLRLHLTGESALVHTLYELLCSRVQRILVREPGSNLPAVPLPASAVHPVGFAEDESIFPYPRRSFAGYRLLQEFFAMPEKFFFLDIRGLESALHADMKNAVELIFLFSGVEGEERRQRLESGIQPAVFRLGCTPIVNLFPQTAEPILLDQRKTEYPVIPDVHRPGATEVFSIDEVAQLNPGSSEPRLYEPFHSPRRGSRQDGGACFWVAHRRPSPQIDDGGTDLYLSLVDAALRPGRPQAGTITVRTTCTNRGLPGKLPFGNATGDFELESGAPIRRIVALRKPTGPLRAPAARPALWHLVSQLSLNRLSLVDGPGSLQHILRLYNFSGSEFAERMIDGIAAVRSRRSFARVDGDGGISFVRGTRVELELDEDQFVGGGAYLFASVIERFLALYASLNSFTQLAATSRQRKEGLGTWPPRAGHQILV